VAPAVRRPVGFLAGTEDVSADEGSCSAGRMWSAWATFAGVDGRLLPSLPEKHMIGGEDLFPGMSGVAGLNE
jgi:hypothetical protein